jgi:hypothetical protein
MRNIIYIFFAVIIFLGGFFLLQNRSFTGGGIVLPKGEAEKITIPNPNTNQENIVDSESIPNTKKDEIEILVTNGVKHNVPLEEILGGGPAKDGIPSIDNPKFENTETASKWLDDEEPGLAFSKNGIQRFYPFQILVWHEIVNDTFGDDRALITYCPLCLSGIVFDPIVDGEKVEFGTSGKLWQSNLVMYDRKTDSLWSQILGESIVGEKTGTKLEVLPFDQMRFGKWKTKYENGEVLSRDTGAQKFYGFDPYGDYYTDSGVFFPVNNKDDLRLEPKDFVLGVVYNDITKAYLPEAIKRNGEVEDKIGDTTFVLKYEEDIDAVRIFKKELGGILKRINPVPSFWFSWAAAHPDTELYK